MQSGMPALRLLGKPVYDSAGEDLDLPAELSTFLLAYLACRGSWIDRGELAALFWPEEDEAAARHSLSQLLYRSRKKPWMAGVESEPRRLRYAGDSDVGKLQEQLARSDWETAVATYTGPLLGGMAGADVPAYQEWLEAERENLLAAWSEAASQHAEALRRAGRNDEAAALLRKALEHDPLSEGILQAYLTAARYSGQRREALGTYRQFEEALRQELGMEPLEVTAQLAADLMRAPAPPAEPLQGGQAQPDPVLRNAPAFLTPLVGRDLELAQLSSELENPGTRLLTII